jgi:hypothetical protein
MQRYFTDEVFDDFRFFYATSSAEGLKNPFDSPFEYPVFQVLSRPCKGIPTQSHLGDSSAFYSKKDFKLYQASEEMQIRYDSLVNESPLRLFKYRKMGNSSKYRPKIGKDEIVEKKSDAFDFMFGGGGGDCESDEEMEDAF